MTTFAQQLTTLWQRTVLQPTRKRLVTLRRWYRRRVKPAVRRWVDDYVAAAKENGA